jgi:hypothetical protein
MQARRCGNWARVAVVAQAGANLLHALLNVVAVCKAVSRQIHLVNIQGASFDQRPPRLTAAFFFPGGNRNARAVAQPTVALDIVRAQRLLKPSNIVV